MKTFYFEPYDYVYRVTMIDDEKSNQIIVCEEDLSGYCKCLKNFGYKNVPIPKPSAYDIVKSERNISGEWKPNGSKTIFKSNPTWRDVKIEMQPNDTSQPKENTIALY